MIIRIWNVGISAGKAQALEKFAHNVSLPMFKSAKGCLGVFFTRDEETCSTITLWDNQDAIDELELSAAYAVVIKQIEESGILCDERHTSIYHTYDGFVDYRLTDLNFSLE